MNAVVLAGCWCWARAAAQGWAADRGCRAKPCSCKSQVAALGVMTELAGGAQAGLLGCGWPAVLRTLSNLAALQVRRAEQWL